MKVIKAAEIRYHPLVIADDVGVDHTRPGEEPVGDILLIHVGSQAETVQVGVEEGAS